MNYGQNGNPKTGGKQPKHRVGKGLGAEKSPTGGRANKDELVARLKAAAEAKAKEAE
jgi:hypothetical protein